ncbi:D111/G-patch [Metarhizium album ARSEF 1941]|uniref:D111/G-patch n=1 Tax=Metarhizium album (strain ARSEF 1941) TaxID=1081103 RepID=A0A0B2WRR6_METAS|nr:D111/G-patch [Metarhizium album ARSEF 1941]KHN96309.1 D111/G-patch [Metarhizium album ARSEF 1941]
MARGQMGSFVVGRRAEWNRRRKLTIFIHPIQQDDSAVSRASHTTNGNRNLMGIFSKRNNVEHIRHLCDTGPTRHRRRLSAPCRPPQGGAGTAPGDGDDEDDYMNMTFDEPAPKKETSLQRTQRLKKESLARGTIKSKAQLAEEAAAAREKALSTSMLETPGAKKSKGLAMMAKMGFSGGALGRKGDDGESSTRTEPIKVSVKEDRGGIGLDSEKKRKLDEAMEEHGTKAAKMDPDEYRERVRRGREDERLEKQVYAAQRVAERMDEEHDEGGSASGEESESTARPKAPSRRPLKSIPALYRGLVRHREQKERDRRMRYDLEQSLSRLPTYDDAEEDEDDRRALGKKATAYVVSEDLDEEDEELDSFDALEPAERLGRLVLYLRERHWYCFWCKMKYDGGEMDGCPGVTEEDHD